MHTLNRSRLQPRDAFVQPIYSSLDSALVARCPDDGAEPNLAPLPFNATTRSSLLFGYGQVDAAWEGNTSGPCSRRTVAVDDLIRLSKVMVDAQDELLYPIHASWIGKDVATVVGLAFESLPRNPGPYPKSKACHPLDVVADIVVQGACVLVEVDGVETRGHEPKDADGCAEGLCHVVSSCSMWGRFGRRASGGVVAQRPGPEGRVENGRRTIISSFLSLCSRWDSSSVVGNIPESVTEERKRQVIQRMKFDL